MDDLTSKFLPQFLQLARVRMDQVRTAAADRGAAATGKAKDGMHTLAGEAGLLGLHDVVPLARDCEQKIKTLHNSGADADAEGVVAALGALERVIERIGATRTSR